MTNRVVKLRAEMKAANLDAIILFKPQNRRYLSAFTGSAGYVVLTENKNLFITDFRYTEQATEQCQGFEIIKHTKEYTIYDILNETGIENIGFEEDFVTVKTINEFKKNCNAIEFKPLEGMIEGLRIIKDEAEVEILAKAAAIADDGFKHILNFIKPGMTEREVSLELEFFMKKQGATGLSFESIVASGVRSSLPHGVASNKVIEDGDFITLDFGAIYDGYGSDMTRTIVVGKANDRQKEIYNTVLKAQEAVLKEIKPGMKGKEVDAIARQIIIDAGYGDNFGHGLGHGVGLEVHEAPTLSPIGETVLEVGMVVTDEPGIYIPEFGGVRIEDLLVITEDGCKILSKSPKELIEL